MIMDLEVAIIQLHARLWNKNWDHYKTVFTIKSNCLCVCTHSILQCTCI